MPLDRHSRRLPFGNWMKRLGLRNSSSEPNSNSSGKRDQKLYLSSKKTGNAKKIPPPATGKPIANASGLANGHGHLSFHTPPSGHSASNVSVSQSKVSLPASSDGQPPPTIGNKSVAPTVSTSHDTIDSDAAYSKADTSGTVGGALSSTGRGGGEGSTFSSPTPSVRSLTTTLTTIQSAAPSTFLAGTNNQAQQGSLTVPHTNHHTHNQSSHFSHQFPPGPLASAIPAHLLNHTGGSHAPTYNMATANNILTDNASILTLASSSKRRRRNSLDTNASVRALAPSSLFGGSRESLPLSVLSANVNDQSHASGIYSGRHPSGNTPNAERASVYSSSGIAPALSSERNSYYAGKQTNAGDGGSTRSGLLGHGRNDSVTGSIGGHTSSPLASPRELPLPGRISRRNSGWGEVNEEDIDSEDEHRPAVPEKGKVAAVASH